jgi:YggT family protein
MILVQFIDLYSLVVLVAVVLSWMQLPYSNPVVQFVTTLTEPLLDPIRRILPIAGGLDFSPMVLLIGLRILRSVVAGAF